MILSQRLREFRHRVVIWRSVTNDPEASASHHYTWFRYAMKSGAQRGGVHVEHALNDRDARHQSGGDDVIIGWSWRISWHGVRLCGRPREPVGCYSSNGAFINRSTVETAL